MSRRVKTKVCKKDKNFFATFCCDFSDVYLKFGLPKVSKYRIKISATRQPRKTMKSIMIAWKHMNWLGVDGKSRLSFPSQSALPFD